MNISASRPYRTLVGVIMTTNNLTQIMRLEAWKSRALGHTAMSRAISIEDDLLEEDEKLKLTFRRESSASLDLPADKRPLT